MNQKLLSVAIEEAKKSDFMRAKVGCIIFKKNKIISRGRNYKQRGCKIKRQFLRWEHSIHAEIDCIIKAKTDLKGMSLLVVRINNKGELRLAKPCDRCMAYIKHIGIKNIYFSTSEFPYIEKLEKER